MKSPVSISLGRTTPNEEPPPTRLGAASRILGVPEPTVRSIHFGSKKRTTKRGKVIQPNGFAPAFIKLGRAIYIDIPVFIAIWRAKGKEGACHD